MTEKEINGMPKKFDYSGDLPTSQGENITKKMYDRYLGYGESIALWKKVSFALFVATILSVGMNIYLSSRNTIVPYVVTVTSGGEVLDVGRVNQINLNPTESQVVYFLNRVIKNIREVPYSMNEYGKRVLENKVFLSPTTYKKVYSSKLIEEITNMSKYKQLREVELKNFTKLENGRGVFVVWEERTINENGVLTNRDTYQSVINLEIVKSDKLDDIKANPLGIKITNMTTKKETSE